MRLDLHFHSRCSDGTETPTELARRGARSGLRLLSLTDHDTIEGVPEFMKECDRLGLRCLTGIEMSATWDGTLHLLGYGFRVDDPVLCGKLASLRQARDERNQLILRRLAEMGLPLADDAPAKEAGGGVVGRPHVAKAMVRAGYVRDIRDAFTRYLGRGAPCYFSKKSFPPEECIAMIQAAGGRVSLAHPYQTAPLEKLPPILAALKDQGLWGLECFSGHHDRARARDLIALARRFDLQITFGSDFHGANRPGYKMGVLVPDELVNWKEFGFSPL